MMPGPAPPELQTPKTCFPKNTRDVWREAYALEPQISHFHTWKTVIKCGFRNERMRLDNNLRPAIGILPPPTPSAA